MKPYLALFLKTLQKAERALLGWHVCQERERSSKLSYLQQRVQLQRDLIAKSDLLTEALRDKHDSQRRKVGSVEIFDPEYLLFSV